MKKFLIALIALCLIFSLCSCGGGSETSSSEDSTDVYVYNPDKDYYFVKSSIVSSSQLNDLLKAAYYSGYNDGFNEGYDLGYYAGVSDDDADDNGWFEFGYKVGYNEARDDWKYADFCEGYIDGYIHANNGISPPNSIKVPPPRLILTVSTLTACGATRYK